jgi:hypothetical protein
MSLFVLATGALISDPQRREGQKGAFATATEKYSLSLVAEQIASRNLAPDPAHERLPHVRRCGLVRGLPAARCIQRRVWRGAHCGPAQ